MLDSLSPNDFEPLIGQVFQVVAPAGAESLTLVEVKICTAAPPEGFRQSFRVLFKGQNPRAMMAQGVYPLAHDTLGRLDLFLSPTQPAPDGAFRYQAVFG